MKMPPLCPTDIAMKRPLIFIDQRIAQCGGRSNRGAGKDHCCLQGGLRKIEKEAVTMVKGKINVSIDCYRFP